MDRTGFLVVPWVLLAASLTASEPIDYLRQVKPLLEERCFSCHGALRQRSGLRLDAAQLIRRGGDSGPAVVPGKSSESPLWLVLSGHDEYPSMPPEGEGAPLEPDQVELVRVWIDAGAPAPGHEEVPGDPRSHWAYRSPVRSPVPAGEGDATSRHPVDRFLGAELERRGLERVPEARPEVLLRRVYLDLVGLPPTRGELREFLEDSSPEAYEHVVDRLLASPRYGERWGRHWMDVWRYSDWFGLPNKMRHSQKHIWRWRDWIVESLNGDKGYDRMVVEMLAGDELAPGDPDVVRGTGFLARSWYLYNRNTWLDDVIEHTGKAFLGLTLNCVKCHEHKYDPIAHDEYYRFRAIFEPHRVRLDPVGTEVDFAKDGLPRAYDADLETETYPFERGEETRPVKTRPQTPGVPAVLGTLDGMIQPKSLGVEAYYPLLRPGAREGLLAAAETAIDDARRQVGETTDNVASLKAKVDTIAAGGGDPDRVARQEKLQGELAEAHREQTLATATLRLKEAESEALRARLAADKARHLDAADAAVLEPLAKRAHELERSAALRVAERAVVVAEQGVARVKAAEAPSEDTKAERVAAAEKTLEEARAKRDAAEEAIGKPATAEYAAVGTIYPATTSGRRTALARWIVARENPLAARVAVNHIWLRHFGAPLVESVFDFGLRAPRPLHQKLLDWLAVELMESGWSMKRLHRLLVTSTFYRLSSAARPGKELDADPDNTLFWRMNSRRLEVEFVRDSLLYLAGDLDETQGGADLPVAAADDGARRTIYYRYTREDQIKFLTMFDAPNVDECYRRRTSIVPQQALAMSNSKLVLARGLRLVERIHREVGESLGAKGRLAFVESAFERILGRKVTEAEQKECLAALDEFTATPENRELPVQQAERRARENLVQVLLNHNDFITIR